MTSSRVSEHRGSRSATPPLRIVETSHGPDTFDQRDGAAISEGLAEAGLSRQDVALVRPLVNDIQVLDDGHLLARYVRTTPRQSPLRRRRSST